MDLRECGLAQAVFSRHAGLVSRSFAECGNNCIGRDSEVEESIRLVTKRKEGEVAEVRTADCGEILRDLLAGSSGGLASPHAYGMLSQ